MPSNMLKHSWSLSPSYVLWKHRKKLIKTCFVVLHNSEITDPMKGNVMLKELFFISCGNIKFFLSCEKKKDTKIDPRIHYAFKFLLVPDLLCPRHLYEIFAWNLYWLDRRMGLKYYSFLFDALYGNVVKSFLFFCWDMGEKNVVGASDRGIKYVFLWEFYHAWNLGRSR